MLLGVYFTTTTTATTTTHTHSCDFYQLRPYTLASRVSYKHAHPYTRPFCSEVHNRTASQQYISHTTIYSVLYGQIRLVRIDQYDFVYAAFGNVGTQRQIYWSECVGDTQYTSHSSHLTRGISLRSNYSPWGPSEVFVSMTLGLYTDYVPILWPCTRKYSNILVHRLLAWFPSWYLNT